ncbi:hypothetical protein GIY21_09780 [Xanthomonas sontii]|uniref:Uncharacterized protein n=1 Tax=Xanthomonas sontii TaxID=2650745 RepID=A0A6N7QBJ3_9XANT|nr:hypothetical protein [Xanthomonas sontii]MRH00577.1 hypothetical protein [Xanthomonas sontii]MRH74909.1 hypothetical protein [Xanthomonas sontii]
MKDSIDNPVEFNILVTERELRYFISCGIALIQNVPEDSLPNYCGLSKNEIIDVSMRLREFADRKGIEI